MFWHKPQITDKAHCVTDAESLRKYVESQAGATSEHLFSVNLDDTIITSKVDVDFNQHERR